MILIFGVIFWLDAMTNHGEKIMVPELEGKNVKSIGPLLENEGLEFEILDSVYMPELAQGTIVSQDPMPTRITGVSVKNGRMIRLRVSKKTQLVEVPNLVDKSQRFAEAILLNRGFKYKIEFKATTESNGAVLEQKYRNKSVAKGTKLPIGSMLVIYVGRDELNTPVPIPDLVNFTISEAKQRLSAYPNVSFNIACEGCLSTSDTLNALIESQSPEFLEGALMQSSGSITVFAKKAI